jgi:NADH-quinone oxidoreductase subunit H
MSPLLLIPYVLVFPGFLFLYSYSFLFEFVDRKAAARMQSRVGPPFLQPFADFVKLLGKEVITPDGADRRVFDAAPALALAAVTAAFFYVPVFGPSPVEFQGDLVVVLYLMTIPTVMLLLIGWLSRNVFATVGGVRCVTQMFIYEVPFYLALLAPALAAGTWSVTGVVAWQSSHMWFVVTQPAGFIVAIIGLQAKLERTPFSIPDAETEIVAGPLTELTGRRLAIMNLSRNVALVTGAALIAALFLGGPFPGAGGLTEFPAAIIGFAWFVGKTSAVLLVLAAMRAGTARLRLDQLNDFGWKVLATLAIAQIVAVLVINAME